MRKFLPIFITIVIIGLGGYFFLNKSSFKPTPTYTGPVQKITIGQIAKYPNLAIIAQNKGYFKENGLDVSLKTYDDTILMIKDLLAGNIDIVAVSAEFLLVRNSFAGEDLKILAIVAKTNDLWAVQARKDKNIQKITDLKAKKIGAQRKTINEFLLGQFLTSNGLDIADVEVVDLDLPTRLEKLSNGQLDAIVTSSPFTEQLEKKLGEGKTITWPAHAGRSVYNLTYTTGHFIKDHQQLAEQYLRATLEAEAFIKDHNPEARIMMQDYMGYSDDEMSAVWPKYSFEVVLEQGLLLNMEDEASWVIANKLTNATKIPNYLDFIYFEGLEKVKLGAVNMLH